MHINILIISFVFGAIFGGLATLMWLRLARRTVFETTAFTTNSGGRTASYVNYVFPKKGIKKKMPFKFWKAEELFSTSRRKRK